MKSRIVLAAVAIVLIIGCGNARAGGYLLLNVANSSELNGTSFGGEAGILWPRDTPKYMLGIGVSLKEVDRTPRYTGGGHWQTARSPWDEVDYYGEVYAAAGFGVGAGFFLTGTVGLTERCKGDVHQGESASQCVSVEGNDTQYGASGSAQLRYIYKHLMVGAGYHINRGAIGLIGVIF